MYAEGSYGARLSQRDGILTVVFVLTIVNILFTIDAVATGRGPVVGDIPAEIVTHALICLEGYLLFLVVRAVDRVPAVLRLLLVFVVCVALGALMFPGLRLVFHLLAPDRPTAPLAWPTLRGIHEGVLPFLFTAAGLMAVDFYRKVQERESQLSRSQALSRQAQMLALRYQIDPHFLFNALNSVLSLILLHRNGDAESLLLRLSNFFRYTLELGSSETVSLEQELELQQAYFHVEQARFGDALSLEIDVEPGLEDVQVPTMLLQPLVENAVKHGARRGVIHIGAHPLGDDVVLTIANDIEASDKAGRSVGTGTGLHNVGNRLRSTFGAEARLEIDRDSAGIHRARLTFPRIGRSSAGPKG